MSDRVTITEASLRDAVRDPRYWTPGHPEREALGEWVSGGFRALYNSGNAEGGAVEVRAYTHQRDGRTEHVGAHTRGAPPGGGMATPVMSTDMRPSFGSPSLRDMPVIGGGLMLAPRPDGWSFPERRRPSLLDPTDEDGRRRGTINGARPFEVPDDENAGPAPGVVESRPPDDGDELDEYTRPKPPPGSKPINETDWSGDHRDLKKPGGAGPADNTRISPQGDIWIENPNGTWTNWGPAGNSSRSGKARGRTGRDRERNRR